VWATALFDDVRRLGYGAIGDDEVMGEGRRDRIRLTVVADQSAVSAGGHAPSPSIPCRAEADGEAGLAENADVAVIVDHRNVHPAPQRLQLSV